MWITILSYIFLLSIDLSISEKKFNKYVSTFINAKWKETPLVLEVAEYLNDENPNFFWKFVDEVSHKSSEFEKSGRYFVLSFSLNFLYFFYIVLI